MTKLVYILLTCLIAVTTFSQSEADSPIYSCEGAINIFKNGDYQFQFTKKNAEGQVDAYPSLQDKLEPNRIWVSYLASSDGELMFEAAAQESNIQMVIFKQERNDICGEIKSGAAEIKRIISDLKYQTVGLSEEVGNGRMYSLPMKKGDKINVVFCTDKKSEQTVDLTWRYLSFSTVAPKEKSVDMRTDEFAPKLSIKVKDKETGMPVVASVAIEGHKSHSGIFMCSELLLSIDRRGEFSVKCDLEGYFFNDQIIKVDGSGDKELIIELERVAQGKSIQLEEIEFAAGTSEILPSSDTKLKRLKDFLALNANLQVEIQGHVHYIGENNSANDKLSEARAKRVMKYLIDNGIDKSRMTAVGYGNTRPIYPDAKFAHEEQSNRRVEIVIK